ncbi:sigma-70 family RNA polymerase sigma factor [Ferruginibacter albus]|uniref:sigma-70 family RNA polymerase sigma factor n=1 Tax=Ferruginibacter albus TaxID=2875540 RepID=UPI001CC7B9F8|nr:sigma-70 family RNA polymerase sigma factor [Ferruginibacter albus]UAY52721.1 sigma-70 family RNA polymerase sigma factor [Ferruginibacter albus]
MKDAMEQYSDIEIIKRVLDGELGLFEVLIRRNNPVLYKIGRSYGYTHEDTQDLMQDTFVDAYRNLSEFEGRSSFKTWTSRIMLNNCFHKRQKFTFKNEMPADINDNSIPMYSNNQNNLAYRSIITKELGAVIENALHELNVDYRMVFSLREINGFSVKETAELLSISESNVKTRLNRAKTILRKEIERSYKAEEIYEFNLVYCDAMVQNVMQRLKKLADVKGEK